MAKYELKKCKRSEGGIALSPLTQ